MTAPISRAAWGAQYDDGFGDRPMPVSEWFLHHSATIAPDLLPPFDDDDAAVRTLERIGEQRFGGGISYTFPITPVGRTYIGHSMHRRGAHTYGHNTVAAAICFVGNYETTQPTEAMLDAAAAVMVAEHRAGRARTHRLNGGHRDVYATACPGKYGYAAIPRINAKADALWAAAPAPPKPPAPLPTRPTPDRAKTRSIQTALELPADGYWGTNTDRAAQMMRHAAREFFGYPTKVNTSWDVRAVQRIIDTSPDGLFWSGSQAALKRWTVGFQRILGVTADGWWGPGTEAAYNKVRLANLNNF